MSTCPYPGPPCTTQTVPVTQALMLSGDRSATKTPASDIGWSKRNFMNPVVSSIKVEITIWDASKKIIGSFKQAGKKENPLKNGYLFYTPKFEKDLSIGQTVIYKMKTKTRIYQFAIVVLAD